MDRIEREIESSNDMLLAYGLPIIDDAMAWDGFSLGGCTDEHSPGLEWGESAWGDKRGRRSSIVAQFDEPAITVEQRAALVAYRARLVETTGQATLGDDVAECWKEIVDNRR